MTLFRFSENVLFLCFMGLGLELGLDLELSLGLELGDIHLNTFSVKRPFGQDVY